MFHFIFILISLTTVNGIEPWETAGGFGKNDRVNECSNYPVPATKQCESSVFYKKLLSLIVYSGKFQERGYRTVEGALHFNFSSSEFKLLKEFLSRSEPLTPKEFRRIDGIIYENISKLSEDQKVEEKWTEEFIYGILFITFLACLYVVYHADWSRNPVKLGIFVIFCITTVAWAIM